MIGCNNGAGALFEDFLKIDFKAEDFGKEISKDFYHLLNSNGIGGGSGFISLSPEFVLGVFCGIFDGLIETINTIGMVSQFIYHETAQMSNLHKGGISSVSPIIDILYHMIKKRSYEEGLADKIFEDVEYSKDYKELINLIKSITEDQIILTVSKILEDVIKDLTLQNGTYAAGYTAGILAFEVILSASAAGAGIVVAVNESIKTGTNFLRNVVEGSLNLSPAKIAQIRALVSASLGALENMLENLPKLKAWYKTDMPPFIKGKLNDFAQSTELSPYLNKLDADLTSMPTLRSWLSTRGVDGVDAWRYMKEASPNLLPCTP